MKLLFIPGSGGGKEEWYYQTRHFPGSEAVVLPGHPEGKLCASIDDYVEWLCGYIRKKRYQDVVLAGHSMGSAIALLYGLKYGAELKALVLIGSGARLRVLPAMLEMLRKMTPTDPAWIKFAEGFYQNVVPEVKQVVLQERLQIGPAVTLNDLLCCDKFDIMDKVSAVKLPTLLICGSEDQMTPVKYTRFLADKIVGSMQVIIPGGTHWVYLEKPQAVNQWIQDFLGRLS